jgi:hypothetical protein
VVRLAIDIEIVVLEEENKDPRTTCPDGFYLKTSGRREYEYNNPHNV